MRKTRRHGTTQSRSHAPGPLSHGAQRLDGKGGFKRGIKKRKVFGAVGVGCEVVHLAPAVVPRRQLCRHKLRGERQVGEREAAERDVLGGFYDGLGLAVEQGGHVGQVSGAVPELEREM